MNRIAATIALTAAFASAHGQSVPDIPAQEIRSLLVAAIDAPAGRAVGVLTGPLADAVRTRFNASGPLQVEVSTLKRYAQPGCRRLNVRFRQDGVRQPGATSVQPQTIDFGINYCRDGSAPESLR